jgi:hypothetical protein
MSLRTILTTALALSLIAGSLACKKKEPEPPKPKETGATSSTASMRSGSPSPNDELTAQLRKVAGTDAKDCGTVPAGGADMQAASDCAMQLNDAKKPFWVRYDLPLPKPQMAIATARAADGKLYTVQYSSDGYKEASNGATLTADKKVMTIACPDAPLRVAGSGRLTCFAPQQNAGAINASPHGGGMAMPGTNPHGDMSMPGANPHGTMPPASGPNPHGTTPPPTPSPRKSH